MEIGDWKATAELNELYRRARSLGIESNLAELESFGFTIIEPEQIDTPGLADRLREAALRLNAEQDPSVVASMARADRASAGRQLFHLLDKDPVFIEALLHPVVLTLGRYLAGSSARLSNTVALVKQGVAAPTVVHCDSVGVPPPLPYFGSLCNVSWILTDYSRDKGTFFMVPGSHRYCRHPTPQDQPAFLGGPGDDEIGIPIEAKPGSILAFHGNTWHGTYAKTDPDTRIHVIYMFCRSYMDPAEDFSDLPDRVIDQYGPDLARLSGRQAFQGYRSEGPDIDKMRAVDRIRSTPTA